MVLTDPPTPAPSWPLGSVPASPALPWLLGRFRFGFFAGPFPVALLACLRFLEDFGLVGAVLPPAAGSAAAWGTPTLGDSGLSEMSVSAWGTP